jgi:hypothetical protein
VTITRQHDDHSIVSHSVVSVLYVVSEGVAVVVIRRDRQQGQPASEELLARLRASGGRLVPARNPYWDEWGVTVEDPDGYRLVLSHRDW